MATVLAIGLVTACADATARSLPPDEWDRVLEEMRPDWEPRQIEAFLTRCLDEGGVTFDYEIKLSGYNYSISGRDVSEQDVAIVEACKKESQQRFLPPPAPSPEELSVIYDLLLREGDCLREQGVDADPPSREEFIDSGGKWTPYNAVTAEEFERVQEICPQDIFAYVGD